MIRQLLFGALILMSMKGYGQFDQIIHFRYYQTPLREILRDFSEQYKVQFSYGNSYVPLDKHLTVAIEEKGLQDALNKLFTPLQIDYIIMGQHIVLRGNSANTENSPAFAMVASKDSSTVVASDQVVTMSSRNKPTSDSLSLRGTYPEALKSYGIDLASVHSLISFPGRIKRPAFVVSPEYQAQRSMLMPYSLGMVTALTRYQFHFAARENADQTYQTKNNYQVGLEAQWVIIRRWSLGLQLWYSRKNFWLNYNRILFDLNDPVAIPRETHLDLAYFEVPIVIHYNWLSTRHWTLSTHLGTMAGWVLSNHETTHFFNNTVAATDFFRGATNRFTWGGTAGIRATYHIREQWRVHVESSLVQYQNKVNEQTMQRATQSWGVGIGLSTYLID
jgi:hypothetical protein